MSWGHRSSRCGEHRYSSRKVPPWKVTRGAGEGSEGLGSRGKSKALCSRGTRTGPLAKVRPGNFRGVDRRERRPKFLGATVHGSRGAWCSSDGQSWPPGM